MYVCMLSTLSKIFSSETTGPIEAKFYVEPPWDVETKIFFSRPDHVTKMAVKTLKHLVQNQKADDLETW